jgi:probable HAF family extracellular repeat protein
MGGINNKEQVVGASCDVTLTYCRAYLWQSTTGMVDLNALIPTDSPLYLLFAFGINDGGEIVGLGLQNSTGEVHAFLATPIRSEASSDSAASAALGRSSEGSTVAFPENVRTLLQQRLRFGRFGARLTGRR